MAVWVKRFLFDLQFMTRIPIPFALDVDEDDMACGMALFPLVALIVGALCAGVMALVWVWTKSAVVSALAAVIMNAYATGGLHIDGLCDVCDGIFSGRSRERTLEIMHDSRMGAFGGVGLFVDMAAHWALVQALLAHGLGIGVCAVIAAPLLGRMGEVAAAWLGKSAREGMGSAYVKGMKPWVFCVALLLTLVLLVCFVHIHALWLTPACVGVALLMVLFFHKRLGGITGDCLGAINEVVEICALLLLAGSVLN